MQRCVHCGVAASGRASRRSVRYGCGDGLLFVMASAALVARNTASLGVGGEFWLQLADGVRQCVRVGECGAVVKERICMRMRAVAGGGAR